MNKALVTIGAVHTHTHTHKTFLADAFCFDAPICEAGSIGAEVSYNSIDSG